MILATGGAAVQSCRGRVAERHAPDGHGQGHAVKHVRPRGRALRRTDPGLSAGQAPLRGWPARGVGSPRRQPLPPPAADERPFAR